ncbi:MULTISPECIES: hypothetical protein [unclassified Thioalkalivibrio]|uniref:hypothetical protein n=1 Tax=unclassified Thioalkalivibrio TaxID=2621013 RepID=UPI0003649012|nr:MULTISPECIES: hypothetical protein [unclassified Thioalkalivibrio]
MQTYRHFPEAADLLQVSRPHTEHSESSSDSSHGHALETDHESTCAPADDELLRLATETLQLIRQLRL